MSCKEKKWTFLRLRSKWPLYRILLKTCRQKLRVIIIGCLKRQYNFHRNLVFNLADQELSSAKLFLVSILYQLQKHTIGSTLRKCFWTIACSNFNLDFIQKPMCVLKVFLMYHLFLLKTPSTWKAQIQEFCHHYARDHLNVVGLPAEFDLWQRIWAKKKEKKGEIPEKIASTLKSVYPASFPNIFTILQILATIPVTSCSCDHERSISCLRYLKNYPRGTMVEERLNGLALMHAHRDIALDLDEIINV